MAIELDHIILAVADTARSIDFYTSMLGLTYDGDSQPFWTLRVTPAFVILLAQGQTSGGEHLAFSMTRPEFDATFARLKNAGVPYGDRFNNVGSNRGPSDESGARGIGKAVYFFDPDRHLIEIRYYEDPPYAFKESVTFLSIASDAAAFGAVAIGAEAGGALAMGAAAVAALAAGVVAIGAITVGIASLWQLTIAEAKVERMEIGELKIGKLTIGE